MKRRKFVKDSTLTVFSLSAFGPIQWNGKNFEGVTPTTTDILGPYYRPGAPFRTNLISKEYKGEIMHLMGTVFQSDGKTPLRDVLIETWQCDEHKKYDNTSEEYKLRGATKTNRKGKYSFKTIVPVPYDDAGEWRPAHIHLRISSQKYQDLVTQVYFKGDPYIEEDAASASPQSASRILDYKENSAKEKVVEFDIVMQESYPLDDAGYRKVTGLYQLENGMAEFIREDDLLIFKMNGQIQEGLVYKGNNFFAGGMGYNHVKFEMLTSGEVKAKITLWDSWSEDDKWLEVHEGTKVLKYGR